MINLDETDRILGNLLQADFPLSKQPFADLGSTLDLTENEVLRRISELSERKIIRIIGPVFNSRALGYQSTLVAMRVPEEKLEQAALLINQHTGVGHNYQRDHFYNLWFTLVVRGDADLNAALQEFEQQIHPEIIFDMPSLRLFKIRLFFDLEGNDNHKDGNAMAKISQIVPLRDFERAVINEVQQNLPLTSRPFDSMARNVGMDTEEFLSCCRSLMERGIMRRFGASIEHQNAGFVANAMVCWVVPRARVNDVGQKIAEFKEVTHCYERKTSRPWPRYNMFAMIHGKRSEENSATVARISRELGISEYEILSTVREFKKERVRYRV